VATFISNNPDETQEFGRRFADEIQAGDVLALTGELGAGKTHFVKGLVVGLGSDAAVVSPTFAILHEYGCGRLPIYHFDLIRLEDRQSIERLGLDEYFFGDGLCVVEWADRFRDLIPRHACWIEFEIKSKNRRAINVSKTNEDSCS
jgi:tRNA threonylcarbamoyladenosine biosynthesis protein TsaE